MTLPLPHHPEHNFLWTELEKQAITAYATKCVAAERERCARLCEAALPSDQFAPVSQQTAGQHQMAAYLASAIREPNVEVSRSPGETDL